MSHPPPPPPTSLLPAFLGISLPHTSIDEAQPPHPPAAPAVEAKSTVLRHVHLSYDCTGPLLLRRRHPDGSSSQAWAKRSCLLPPPSSPTAPPPPSSISAQPRLVTKEDSSSKGRGRYTTFSPTSTAAPGTLLMSAPASVAVVASPSLERFCHVCLRPPLPGKKIKICGGCHTAHYCSQACFGADEDVHQLLCLRLKRLRVHANRQARLRQMQQQQQQQQQQQGSLSVSSFDTDAVRLALQVLGLAVHNFGKRAAKRKDSSSSSSSSSGGALSMPPPFSPQHDELGEVMALVAHKEAEEGRLWEEALTMARMLAEPTTAAERGEEGEGGREEWGSRGDVLFRMFPPYEVADLVMRIRINSHPCPVSIPSSSSSSSSSSGRTTPFSSSAQQQQQQHVQQVQILGLFPSVAGNINHSCRPSAALSFSYSPPHQGGREGGREGGPWHQHLKAELRAVRGLEGGEEVTYSYISALHFSRGERRELLQQGFHFLCGCCRCVEEEKEGEEGKKGGRERWACLTCGGRVGLVLSAREEAEGERKMKTAAKDKLIKCMNLSRSCLTLLPQHHYHTALKRGQYLVARAREIMTMSFSLSSSSSSLPPSLVECLGELCEWLVSVGSLGGGGGGREGGEARLLADAHPLRCEAALLLMSMGQGGGGRNGGRDRVRKTREEEMAVAVAAGAMGLFLVGKGLQEQPQRASFLVMKAKAMWALAQGREGGRGVWREALQYHACCLARDGLGIYKRAWGKEHAVTIGVERMVKEMEGGREGGREGGGGGGGVVEHKEEKEGGEGGGGGGGGECRKSSEVYYL